MFVDAVVLVAPQVGTGLGIPDFFDLGPVFGVFVLGEVMRMVVVISGALSVCTPASLVLA
jgi:hypothetical protein